MAKILIVDDNPTNRSYLVTLLGYGGHLLIEAADGAEALVLVNSERPDLVIADILMPTMDGYEFVRLLRLNPALAHTPVIFCTAHFRERDADDLARQCGVAYVLTKPCDPETVRRAVDSCLATGSKKTTPKVDERFASDHLRLLTDKLSDQTRDLALANLRLQALIDMSVRLACESDPGHLLNRFCYAARDLIPSSYSVVIIPSAEVDGPVLIAAAGIEEDPFDIVLPLAHEVFARAKETRRPTRILNPTGDPTVLGFPSTFRPFRSLLVAPVTSPTRDYGWLGLFQRLGAPEFNEEDEQLTAMMASLVGRIYENGRMYVNEKAYAALLEREITDRRIAQEASAQLADIVNSCEDAIIGMTTTGTILSWNRGAERTFGYSSENARGRTISLIFGSSLAGELGATLKSLQEGETVPRYEAIGTTQTGGKIDVAVTMSPILKSDGSLSGASAIVRDITETKRLQRQVLVAQKMEAIGRVSAGIAHDFNNLLTVIKGYGSIIVAQRTEEDPEYNDLLEINKAADRAAILTRQLLTFSSRRATQPRVVALNTIVADTDRMLRRVIGEDIELASVLDISLSSVMADISGLEQIIMNLAVNARDAMPAGGKLTIQTANVTLQSSLTVRNTVVPPGAYVVLSMTDTGTGMDSATQDRIFEPFFTTKGPGHGTGLGLAMVYGIVEQSGGAVVVESELGHGATFRIYLPAVQGMPVANPVSKAQIPHRGGAETILVVEDDNTIRGLLCRILTMDGYVALEASNGDEALLVSRQHAGAVDLMVSDITMPGMSGVELARRIREARVDLKILLMSGYAEKAIGALAPDMPFLEKPFSAQLLRRRIREVLDGTWNNYTPEPATA